MKTNSVHQIKRIIIVRFEGNTPPELELQPIETGTTAALVKESLRLFSEQGVVIQDILDFKQFSAQERQNIYTVIYFVGHAWTNDQGLFCVSMKYKNKSKILTGDELANYIEKWVAPDAPLIVFVDTCEAEHLKNSIKNLNNSSIAAIFASRYNERAWNLIFGLKLSKVLKQVKETIGIALLAESIAKAIDEEPLLNHQHVNYWVQGNSICLSRYTEDEIYQRRNKVKQLIMSCLVFVGLILAGLVFAIVIYWYRNVFITINIGNVNKLTESATIEVFHQNPEQNRNNKIDSFLITKETSIRRNLPAQNLVIIFRASYHDGQSRAIHFHNVYLPGLFSKKFYELVLPSSEEIAERGGMAYVSVNHWLQGETKLAGSQLAPFWIDIKPTTVSEYFPFVYDLYKQGKIEVYESMLISNFLQNSNSSSEDIRNSLSATDLLTTAKIDKNSPLTCPECPAPMTSLEAQLYNKASGKRLPSREEWEVAVRGVDGRNYPWGNIKDNKLINAGLPRDIGPQYSSKLQPVLQYPEVISPFGLIDTVGNAGDWVEDKTNGLGFMGGEFKLNAEECTTYSFMRLPSSEMDFNLYSSWMITSRGVLDAK